ncbi:YtzI protein [Mesobacillus subterraneus]|uniref:YtzI protein n=1 Tax=Mesobacillus subterraneus TaxID=285983 RepID=A0A0D6Z670_9BACI|nr:YtzI protein [Mesobacillus subterraneus]KIY21092.1 hypothetical protein UB32_15565 [Mesobacillus subterraneus]
MYTILIISVLIVILVLVLSVFTTSKAYQFKHTVDPIESNSEEGKPENETKNLETNKKEL